LYLDLKEGHLVFTTPATWFPATYVHNGWLTEACALALVLAIIAAIAGAMLWDDFGNKKPSLFAWAGAAISLAAGLVMWFGPLNDYTDDAFSVGYWTQQVYFDELVLLVCRHAIIIIGLTAVIASIIRLRDYRWYRFLTLGDRLLPIGGAVAGLTIMAAALFVNV
jgi:hypothetical protein